MNKRRLLKLADLMEADAKDARGIKFNFCRWGTVENPNKPLSCGTQACAMGLAALSGAFKRAGLGFQVKKGGELVITSGNSKSPVLAAMRTFEIPRRDAQYLFTSNHDLPAVCGADAERAVAKRLRDYVARGSAY